MVDACLSCGACCAAFRVDFHCADLASAPGGCVPVALTLPLTATLVRMRGTDEAPPRCVALEGKVGQSVCCTIYEQRPGPCRDFAPYAPLGIGDEACDRARRRYGLPPLAAGLL
jgi:Fe-S-cluster containining protein